MNCPAVCWYHLYLIVTHHRSDSRGHEVMSCRKYSLKNDVMARPSRIMQSHVPWPEHESPDGDTNTKTSSRSASTVNITGWPSAPTVCPQWPNKVRNCPTEKTGSSPQTYPYPAGWSTTGWFKQNIMNVVPGGNLCRPEVSAITDIVGMGAQQVATRTLQSCGLKRWVKVYW